MARTSELPAKEVVEILCVVLLLLLRPCRRRRRHQQQYPCYPRSHAQIHAAALLILGMIYPATDPAAPT